jgi:hypothetical protein
MGRNQIRGGDGIAGFGPAKAGGIRHVAFTPKGETLISAFVAALAFWKVADVAPIGEPLSLASRPRQIEFSADGKRLLVRENPNSLSLYETALAQFHLEPITSIVMERYDPHPHGRSAREMFRRLSGR